MSMIPILDGSGNLKSANQQALSLRLREHLDRHNAPRPSLSPAQRDELRARAPRWAVRAQVYEVAIRRFRGW